MRDARRAKEFQKMSFLYRNDCRARLLSIDRLWVLFKKSDILI